MIILPNIGDLIPLRVYGHDVIYRVQTLGSGRGEYTNFGVRLLPEFRHLRYNLNTATFPATAGWCKAVYRHPTLGELLRYRDKRWYTP